MKKLNWGILIVTLLISVLALTSAVGAHRKANRLRVELENVRENNELLIDSLKETFERNNMSYHLEFKSKRD